MTKALVIYDTKFGNTEKVATALVQGLAAQGIEELLKEGPHQV
jgi:flavodoxin